MKKRKLLWCLIALWSMFTFTNVVSAESISGYDATVSTKKNLDSVSFDESGNAKSVTITGTASYGYYEYAVSGLDKNKIYIAKAEIKTNNVTGEIGGMMGIIRNTSGVFYNYSFTKGILGTNDWQEDAFIFTADEQGNAKLIFGIGYNRNEYGYGTGTASFRNIRIQDAATDTTIKIGESQNKKIKLVTWKKDYDESTVTAAEFQTYLNRLETMYNNFVELVGNSSHGTLYPYNSKQVAYIMTNYHPYGGLAGFPIEINRNSALNVLSDAKTTNKISWLMLHEMGHLFNKISSNQDQTYTTSSERFSIDSEQSASFYPLYVLEKMNIITSNNLDYNGWINKYKTTYDTTLAKGEWNGDALSYLLTRVQKNNKVDWDAFKNTYKWFNDLSNTTFNNLINNKTNLKFVWYLKKLDDYSTTNVRNIFNDAQLTAILKTYKPFSSVDINITGKDIILTDGYKLNPKTMEDSLDVLVYEVSDKNVAEVDDFGNVHLKSTNADQITITVRSFLKPTVKDSYTFKLKREVEPDTGKDDDNDNEDKNDDNDHEIVVDKDENDVSNKDENTSNEGVIENPKTGIVSTLIPLSIIGIFAYFTLCYCKKKNIFKNL